MKKELTDLEEDFKIALQEGYLKIKEVLDQIEPAIQKLLNQAAEISEQYGIPFEYYSGEDYTQVRQTYTPQSWKEKFGELTCDRLDELKFDDKVDLVYPREEGWVFSTVCY